MFKARLSTLSGFRQVCLSDTMLPPQLNTCSTDTLVAYKHEYLHASFATLDTLLLPFSTIEVRNLQRLIVDRLNIGLTFILLVDKE